MFAHATQTTAAPVIALQQPVTWMCIDLETGDAPESAVQAAIDAWKAPSTWKPETVESKRKEAAKGIREKAALLDASPILCVAMQTDNSRTVWNGMDEESYRAIDGWHCIGCGDEKRMLTGFREWLDRHTTPVTTIVGHNIKEFDLPKLRHAYIRHGMKLPEILRPRLRDEERAEVVDTAHLFKAFSMEHRDDFCPSLDIVATGLGIPRPKEVISGADVPVLHRSGEYMAILTYCCIDATCTARAWQLMTSTAPNLI